MPTHANITAALELELEHLTRRRDHAKAAKNTDAVKVLEQRIKDIEAQRKHHGKDGSKRLAVSPPPAKRTTTKDDAATDGDD